MFSWSSIFSIAFKFIGGWKAIGVGVVCLALGAFAAHKVWSWRYDSAMLEHANEQIAIMAQIAAENQKQYERALEYKQSEIEALKRIARNALEQQQRVEETMKDLENAPKEDDRTLSDTFQRFFDRLRK